MGAPLTVGYGEGENYLGSDALAVAPWTQRIAYLDEGDWAVVRREGIQIFDRDNQPRRARHRRVRRLLGPGREGQLPPLHAEGDLRAADRGCPDSPDLCPPVRRRSGAACRRIRPGVGRAAWRSSPAARLLRRDDRQILDRAVRRHPRRGRCRERVPLPRPGPAAQHARHRHLAVGRDRRHARRASPHEGEGRPHRGHHQRADQLDGARGRPAAARRTPARRSASPRPRRSPASSR